MQSFASLLLISALGSKLLTSALPDPVQTYFVPLPEQDLYGVFKDITPNNPTAVSGNVQSVISLAVAAANTVIYYDHWEDGYEADPRLRTQSSTQIWGDGDLSNGIAPGTTNDILRGGSAIVLSNGVVVNPRNKANIFFDGGDRIQASLPIAVTRYAFPDQPGSLIADSVEVLNFGSWGRRFIAPVGQNTPDYSGTSPFEYSRFFVMAGEEGTEIFRNGIQIGGSGAVFNTGASVSFIVNEGDVITSTRPVQTDLIVGDINDTYELRWYSTVDANDWTNEYISPVAETLGNTGFWFYNPHDYPIQVSYNGGNTDSGTFTVPVKASKFIPSCHGSPLLIPSSLTPMTSKTPDRYSGVRFKSSGDNFFAFAQIDANGSPTFGGAGQVYDWGWPMIPTSQLTSQALVGLGQGCTYNKCTLPTDQGVIGSRNVVWVTPIEDTIIFVDYDGDGVFDAKFPLRALLFYSSDR